MSDVVNVFADEWQDIYPPTEGWRSNQRRLVPPGHTLGMSVVELLPGQTQAPYHFHHGNEELVLVLSGTPTLRTPEGERELRKGDFIFFPKGPGRRTPDGEPQRGFGPLRRRGLEGVA